MVGIIIAAPVAAAVFRQSRRVMPDTAVFARWVSFHSSRRLRWRIRRVACHTSPRTPPSPALPSTMPGWAADSLPNGPVLAGFLARTPRVRPDEIQGDRGHDYRFGGCSRRDEAHFNQDTFSLSSKVNTSGDRTPSPIIPRTETQGGESGTKSLSPHDSPIPTI